MTHTSGVRTVLLAIGLSVAAHAADDSCKVLFDADRKMIVTAHHSYQHSFARPERSQSREMIYTGGRNGAVYIHGERQVAALRIWTGRFVEAERGEHPKYEGFLPLCAGRSGKRRSRRGVRDPHGERKNDKSTGTHPGSARAKACP